MTQLVSSLSKNYFPTTQNILKKWPARKRKEHIRDAGGLGRGIPFLSDFFFSHRILAAWFI
jgi:hypothetical protein